MEHREEESLEAALREGVISREQYEVLVAKMVRDRLEEISERTHRRVLWIGLVLLGILVLYASVSFLTVGQRLTLVLGALIATAIAAVLFWRDREKFDLSRGLVGLAVVEAMIALFLARHESYVSQDTHLLVLIAVTSFGAFLGIHQNSTWLASPSFFALYIGLLSVGFSFQTEVHVLALGVSVTIALAVAGMVGAWHAGYLLKLRDAYARRRGVLGQLARGHLVLFGLYLPVGILIVLPRAGFVDESVSWLVALPSYLVALIAVLYARWAKDVKLLTTASILLALVTWLFLFASRRVYVWPFAVLVTASVLIFLGVWRGRSFLKPSPVPPAGRSRDQ